MTYLKNIAFKRPTIRFIFVGAIGAIVELGLFSGLVRLGINIFQSNIIAFHCAFALCFFLHYYYTHQKPYEGRREVASGFGKYAALMYAQLMVGSLLLWVLLYKLTWTTEIAKIIQIAVVTPLSYVIQKLMVFRRGKKL